MSLVEVAGGVGPNGASAAIDLARKLCSAEVVDIVEAGTPLIKAAGVLTVSALRVACPNAEIMADLKTMDVGALEARLAINAGASIVSVLGAAANETIGEFINETRRFGAKSLIDMISVKNLWRGSRSWLMRG